MAERGISNGYFGDQWSGFWAIIAAEELVGYGDVYPLTDFGRLVISVDIFLGIVTMALVLTITHSKAQLSTAQQKFTNEFIYLQKRDTSLIKSAVALLQRFWRLHLMEHRVIPHNEYFRSKMKRQLHCFKLERIRLESERKDDFVQKLERIGKHIQTKLISINEALQPARAASRITYFSQSFSFNHRSKARSIFQSAKKCRRLYMDLIIGPGYREKRPSLYSQRNSSVSITSNLNRLSSLMAQEKYIRTLTGYESMGNSPRVSFEALRRVRDDTFFRLKTTTRG